MILRAIMMAGAALTFRGLQESVSLLSSGPSPKAASNRPRNRAPAASALASPSAPRQAPTIDKQATEGRDVRLQLADLWTNLRYWAVARRILFSGRRILPLRIREREAYLALRVLGVFDGDWYLEQNPDVLAAGVDPLHHLVKHGISEGRAPSRDLAVVPTRNGSGPAEDDARTRYLRAIEGLAHATYLPRNGANVQAVDRGHLHRLSDLAVMRGLARFEHFPLFKPDDYLALNATLRAAPGLDARRHAFTYGFSEGRSVFDRQTIANELGLRSRATALPETAQVEASDRGRLSISIVHNASGNLFLTDIARCLAHDLRSAGNDVVLLSDMDDPSRMREHNIIVAPHEFFFLGRGPAWISDDVLSRSVMYNTEQPQTVWFDRAVPFNLVSRGVIDLSSQVASMYGDCMPTIHCEPCGPTLDSVEQDPENPLVRVLPRDAQGPSTASSPMDARSIDVSFFGGTSAHRDRFFAKTARFFADYKTLFYCRRASGPLLAGEAIDLTAVARHVAFHSKLVLNIHRDEFGFFEWHRIVRLGIEAGAVVVSEPCLPHPYLKPNVHYFEESGRHIQNLVEWLLKTPDGRTQYRKVKHSALDLVRRRRLTREPGNRIADFLSSLEGAS